MAVEMNYQIKQRLYITLVALSLLWLLSMGVVNLSQVNESRSLALTDCMKDHINVFEICYPKTNDEIRPTLWHYLSPFIPVIILLWISWVFKFDFQIDVEENKTKIQKITMALVYIVSFLGFIIPIYIVLEQEVDRLYAVLFYNLFLMPWLAISWISIPIFFQKLLDKELRLTEFIGLPKFIYMVAAAPFLAILILIIRTQLKI